MTGETMDPDAWLQAMKDRCRKQAAEQADRLIRQVKAEIPDNFECDAETVVLAALAAATVAYETKMRIVAGTERSES